MGIDGLEALVAPLMEKGYVTGTLTGLRVSNDGTRTQHVSMGRDGNRRPTVYRQDPRNAKKDNYRYYKALARELGSSGLLHILWEGNILPGKGATIDNRRTYASLTAAINTLQSRAYYFATTDSDSKDDNDGEAPPLSSEDPQELERLDAVFREEI